GRAPDYTEYVVAALPLGGYVRMLDERDGKVDPADLPRAFGSKPPWQRILVMLAGPAANILFAILLLWGMFLAKEVTTYKAVIGEVTTGSIAATAGFRSGDQIVSIDGEAIRDRRDASLGLFDSISDDGDALVSVRGEDGRQRVLTIAVPDPDKRRKLTEPFQLNRGLGFEYWLPTVPARIDVVDADGPAGKAGLKPGDLIVALDGTPVRSFGEFRSYVIARPETEILIAVRRDGNEFSRRVRTASDKTEGKPIGRLMIEGPNDLEQFMPEGMKVRAEPGVFSSLGNAVGMSWQMTVAQAKFFVRMITGKVSTKNISGFISIADAAGQAARSGAYDFLMILVLLSLSLGFLNLLPIPILDGGQIVFQLAEWAKGGPLSDRTYMVGQQAGLLLLVLLMGLALFNDLSRYLFAHS
ncbi:MAG TPA: RIP metalloprotease RseP, partial [Vicinamibacterales bacterium]|nr:RIP metalloprotease RseP [Vicinamibacterales bacterium]